MFVYDGDCVRRFGLLVTEEHDPEASVPCSYFTEVTSLPFQPIGYFFSPP